MVGSWKFPWNGLFSGVMLFQGVQCQTKVSARMVKSHPFSYQSLPIGTYPKKCLPPRNLHRYQTWWVFKLCLQLWLFWVSMVVFGGVNPPPHPPWHFLTDPNDLKSLVGLSDTRFIADLQMFFGGQGINVVTKAAAESWWIAPGTYKIDDTKQMNRRFAIQSLRNLEWKYLHSLLFQTWRCLKPLYRFALLVWRCRPIVKPLSNHKAFRPAKSNPWLLKNLLKLQQHDMNRFEPNKKALLCSSSTNTSTLFLVPVHNWLFDK